MDAKPRITENIASSTPSISVDTAISKAEDALAGKYNSHPASIQYLVKSDGSAALTHVIQIRNEDAGTWYDAFVDAHSGDLLHVTDFVAKASVGSMKLYSIFLTQVFILFLS